MHQYLDNKRILIVDDNHELLDVLQQGLKSYTLMVAGDGKEAVEQAYTLQPDLILMDIMMPEMDGPEAIRLIRQNPKTRSIPILAISAGISASAAEECALIGCDDFIAKPFSFKTLRSRIERLLFLHPR
jgi:two-component system, cell cycle response regulator DivK